MQCGRAWSVHSTGKPAAVAVMRSRWTKSRTTPRTSRRCTTAKDSGCVAQRCRGQVPKIDAERDYLPPIALYSVSGATSAFLASLMRLEIAALVSLL